MVATDHILICVQSKIHKFIVALSEKIFDLCHYHYMKYLQLVYLKLVKERSDNHSCFILMGLQWTIVLLSKMQVKASIDERAKPLSSPFTRHHKDIKNKSWLLLHHIWLFKTWSSCSSLFSISVICNYSL